MEGDPEEEKLVLGVPDRVAHWLAVGLEKLLPLCEPEGEEEAVPLRPSAASPLVALRLAVPQPLKDAEVVRDAEGDAEADAVPRWPRAAAPPVALGLPVAHSLHDTDWVGVIVGELEDEKQALGETDSVNTWLASRGVTEELRETVAQVVAQCEELCVPEGGALPDEVTQPVAVALWLEDCETQWLALAVKVLLGHWVREAEREPVPVKTPLGELEGLSEVHVVGVCVLHMVPLSVAIAVKVRDTVVMGLREGVTEMLPEAVGPAGELEGEAVPGAAPKVGLRLCVSHPLEDNEGVGVVDAKPEAVKLVLEEKEPLAEAHCVPDCVAVCISVKLAALLALPLKEAAPEAEPRWPSAAAPPEALGLSLPHALLDSEGVVEGESEPELE